MAKWQPPIPAGALWSADAVKLGPALALLAWCYDAVRRDGTLTISIADVAGDLDVEYRTIKRYWAELRAGPFFCDITDHGKRGYEVRFCDDWIDWRVLNARQPRAVEGTKTALEDDKPSRPDEGTNVSPDDLQSPVKAPSRPDEGTDMALNTSAYKVLNTTVLAEGGATRKARTPRASQTEMEADPVAIYRAVTKARPNEQQRKSISEKVSDLDVWRATCELFMQNNWNYRHIGNLVNRYEQEVKTKARTTRTATNGVNGHRPPAPTPEELTTGAELARLFREARS